MELFALVENAFARPCSVCAFSGERDEVTAASNVGDGNNRRVANFAPLRALDSVHQRIGVKLAEGGEPFDIGQMVRKGAEFIWEIEDGADLRYMKS